MERVSKIALKDMDNYPNLSLAFSNLIDRLNKSNEFKVSYSLSNDSHSGTVYLELGIDPGAPNSLKFKVIQEFQNIFSQG